jgi:hypothetical protein
MWASNERCWCIHMHLNSRKNKGTQKRDVFVHMNQFYRELLQHNLLHLCE